MKTFAYLILFLVVFLSESKSQTYEIFPLKEGFSFLYDYHSINEEYYINILESSTLDHGTVEYVVLDSSIVNDTTVLWNIRQHEVIKTKSNLDTSFIMHDDTCIIPLLEYTVDRHKLIINGTVWSFPIDSAHSVFRYSESPDFQIILSSDSLWFSDTLGFFSRSSYNTWSYPPQMHSHYARRLKVSLLERSKVSSVSELILPMNFELSQNFPNPFNPTTIINYSVPKQSNVMLLIYDALGREVTTLINEEKEAGNYTTEFNATNLSSGIYFYQIRAGEFIQTKKMVLLR